MADYTHDIDLHPLPSYNPSRTTVDLFELESLYEAHRKTCIQLTTLQTEHDEITQRNLELQASLDESKIQLQFKERQLEEERSKLNNISQNLAQQCVLNSMLVAKVVGVPRLLYSLPTNQATSNVTAGQTDTSTESHVSGGTDSTVGESEEGLKKRLKKLEALYDMQQQENKSMSRMMAKLKSKLRILGDESHATVDIGSNVTVCKQGRFMVQRKQLECEQCRLVFGSHQEAQDSVCLHHKMNAVPQDGPDGKKMYWLCCSQAVTSKGQANGCLKDKHKLKRHIEE